MIQATDKDVGDNAKIKYSSSSVHFLINEETGVIYPNFNNEDALTELFTVTATDRNGKGRQSELQVQVCFKHLNPRSSSNSNSRLYH